jgi:hypothetical protein
VQYLRRPGQFKKHEAFLLQLLVHNRAGDWLCVRELCRQTSVNPGNVKEDLFVCWLSDPGGNDGYAVVFFYDDESKWSMAAHYNRERLMDGPSGQRKDVVLATDR